MGKNTIILLFLSLICALTSGCQSIIDAIVGDDAYLPEEVINSAVYNPDGPCIRPGVGLIVQLTITGQQTREMTVMADEHGAVLMPYLLKAPIQCDGMSLDTFRQTLVNQYQEFIRYPQITARFAPYDTSTGVSPWGTITVLGQVGREGPVNLPPTMDMTVTKALQAAGGLKPFANKSRIRVTRREKDGRLVKTIVDLEEIGVKGRADKDMTLRAGDVVYAHETYW